jgi:hypothetical protein
MDQGAVVHQASARELLADDEISPHALRATLDPFLK